MHKSLCLWHSFTIGVCEPDTGGFQVQGNGWQLDLVVYTLEATPKPGANGWRDKFCRFCRILVRIYPRSVKKIPERAAWIRSPSF